MNTRLCQNAEPLFFAQKNTPEKREVLWFWRSCQTGQLLSGPAWVFSHNVIMHQ